MNIIYNQSLGRFEAVFSTDFAGDYNAVKAAKFKCDGPPGWVWWTKKIAALNGLRENRPASGLMITDEAFEWYTNLVKMEESNAKILADAKPVLEEEKKAKKQRRKQHVEEQTYHVISIPEKPGEDFDHIGPGDLPPMPPRQNAYIRPDHPGPWCMFCGEPLYSYERNDLCLYCEKTLDRNEKVV